MDLFWSQVTVTNARNQHDGWIKSVTA